MRYPSRTGALSVDVGGVGAQRLYCFFFLLNAKNSLEVTLKRNIFVNFA